MTQKYVNDACVCASEIANQIFHEPECALIGKLRSCNATVYTYEMEKGRVFILKSYNTIVAIIGTTGRCYDFLRYVYGYTATSAQHISKFFHDYAPENAERLTYRD